MTRCIVAARSGAAAAVIAAAGETLATSRLWPNWNEGTEFRGVRAESDAARK